MALHTVVFSLAVTGAIAQDDFVKPANFENLSRLGCNTIEQNRSLDVLSARIGRNLSIVNFFLYADCRNVWSGDPLGVALIPPMHLLAYDPKIRLTIGLEVIHEIPLEQASSLLNRQDRSGRTVLDYMEQVLQGRYATDAMAKRNLSRLSIEICRYGGQYYVALR